MRRVLCTALYVGSAMAASPALAQLGAAQSTGTALWSTPIRLMVWAVTLGVIGVGAWLAYSKSLDRVLDGAHPHPFNTMRWANVGFVCLSWLATACIIGDWLKRFLSRATPPTSLDQYFDFVFGGLWIVFWLGVLVLLFFLAGLRSHTTRPGLQTNEPTDDQ